MEIKCTACGLVQPQDKFSSGEHRCKQCMIIKSAKYKRTKQGIITQMFSHMKTNSAKRGHTNEIFSKDNFIIWLEDNNFNSIFNRWKQHNFERDYTPSIDRIDETKGYWFNNMKLITSKENWRKQKRRQINGEDTRMMQSVRQYTKDKQFIKEFFSLHNAERETGVTFNNIAYASIDFEKRTAGGYKWKRVDKIPVY